MVVLEVSEEQAFYLWVLLNNVQAYSLERYACLVEKMKSNLDYKPLREWTTESALEHAALFDLKVKLKKLVLERKV